ncbi:hypothetical protein GmarT_41580 [Gimesia maris]|uniref:Uncharacterized protein n=1 Tax=Gimesia maris TaxID=122 RepID=A0ABX5YRK1_9PLAN|nr:hypothetical protein GmarT_41580 [Gimesia maris]
MNKYDAVIVGRLVSGEYQYALDIGSTAVKI